MYQEQARRHGQDISTTTDDGTFAGGLRHITSVLPSLMNDIIQHAPDSQKVCINYFSPKREKTLEENTLLLSYNSILHVFLLVFSPFIFSWDSN